MPQIDVIHAELVGESPCSYWPGGAKPRSSCSRHGCPDGEVSGCKFVYNRLTDSCRERKEDRRRTALKCIEELLEADVTTSQLINAVRLRTIVSISKWSQVM